MMYGTYTSNDTEVINDGTILSKIGISIEDIKCKASFDITIELASGTKFTGNIALDLPSGNIVNSGIWDYEKTNFRDVVFKRN